jgi:hypothetical protein
MLHWLASNAEGELSMHVSRAFISVVALVALVAMVSWTNSAKAADIESEPPKEAPAPANEWSFTVAPYLWDVGLFGQPPVNVDMSFGDILDNLKFAGMLAAEAHNGTWGVAGDLIYVSIADSETATRSVLGTPTSLSLGVKTKSFTGTLMGEYRVIANPDMTMDLMAGVRLWSVDNDISASLTFGGTPVAAFSGSDGATWVDPMIGAKARFNTNSPWYFSAWGLIGGFGASADIDWDLFGSVGYQWNDKLSTVLGYRALGVNYSSGGFVYDVVQQGPVLGMTYKF